MAIILSGRKFGAAESLKIGFLQVVLPHEDFEAVALDWAGRIAAHYRPALVSAKRAVVDGQQLPLADGLALERSLVVPQTVDPVSVRMRDELAARYASSPSGQAVDF